VKGKGKLWRRWRKSERMEEKGRKNIWGKGRKEGLEMAKQIGIWTERKRETGNNGLLHKK
jgi:hypothetical protein